LSKTICPIIPTNSIKHPGFWYRRPFGRPSDATNQSVFENLDELKRKGLYSVLIRLRKEKDAK
jgi:hypothetical protein